MRRNVAWRTQGTLSKAARALSRSMEMKLPASRGVALARMVATLLRCSSPSSWITRKLSPGERVSHSSTAAPSATPTSTYNVLATPFISRMSKGIAVSAAVGL